MRKTNKLISFACSVAMMAGAFSGVITASAEDDITSGIQLVYNEAESSSNEAVIDIVAKGVDEVSSWQADIQLPEDVTLTLDNGADANSVSFVKYGPLSVAATYVADRDMYAIGGSVSSTNHVIADAGEVLATITLPFSSDLASDITLTLTGNSMLEGKLDSELAQYFLYDGSMQDASVVVAADPTSSEAPTESVETEAPTETVTASPTAEPTATPYATTRPTAIPTATPEVTAEPVPTAEPVTEGISFVYNESESTNSLAVIDIVANGVDEVSSWQADIQLPEDVALTLTNGADANAVSFVKYGPLSVAATYVADRDMYAIGGSVSSTNHVITTDGNVLATISLPFTAALESNIQLTLTGNSMLEGRLNSELAQYFLYDGSMANTFVTVLANPNADTPSEAPSETPAFDNDGEIKLSDLIKNAPATDDTLGNLVAVVVEATVGNDAAVYGEDFVAEYNDEELTEDEYFNLINGYTETDMTKVIDGLVFLVNDGVTVKASPAYQTEEQAAEGTMTVVPGLGGEQTYTNATEAPGKDEVTLTVEEPTHGSITVSYTVGDNSYSYDTDDDGDIEVNIPSGTSVKFKASADRNYEFSRWGDDLSGTSTSKTVTVNKDMTVSARFTKVDDSSSSSSGSGSSWNTTNPNGPIAGSGSQVGGGTTGFQDLGSVPWAQTAINSLTSAGIINGRSSTIFDPNASVTRAEFAKMVCLTFGITEQTTGTQRFTDVGPSDWFYGYVQAAAATGIVNGVSDTAFDPNATIKRQEMAAMLYRAISATGNLAKLPAGSAITFVDADQIDDYAQTPVSTLSAAGVINGTTDNQFEPLATATRAQAACIIYQYLTAVQ